MEPNTVVIIVTAVTVACLSNSPVGMATWMVWLLLLFVGVGSLQMDIFLLLSVWMRNNWGKWRLAVIY